MGDEPKPDDGAADGADDPAGDGAGDGAGDRAGGGTDGGTAAPGGLPRARTWLATVAGVLAVAGAVWGPTLLLPAVQASDLVPGAGTGPGARGAWFGQPALGFAVGVVAVRLAPRCWPLLVAAGAGLDLLGVVSPGRSLLPGTAHGLWLLGAGAGPALLVVAALAVAQQLIREDAVARGAVVAGWAVAVPVLGTVVSLLARLWTSTYAVGPGRAGGPPWWLYLPGACAALGAVLGVAAIGRGRSRAARPRTRAVRSWSGRLGLGGSDPAGPWPAGRWPAVAAAATVAFVPLALVSRHWLTGVQRAYGPPTVRLLVGVLLVTALGAAAIGGLRAAAGLAVAAIALVATVGPVNVVLLGLANAAAVTGPASALLPVAGCVALGLAGAAATALTRRRAVLAAGLAGVLAVTCWRLAGPGWAQVPFGVVNSAAEAFLALVLATVGAVGGALAPGLARRGLLPAVLGAVLPVAVSGGTVGLLLVDPAPGTGLDALLGGIQNPAVSGGLLLAVAVALVVGSLGGLRGKRTLPERGLGTVVE